MFALSSLRLRDRETRLRGRLARTMVLLGLAAQILCAASRAATRLPEMGERGGPAPYGRFFGVVESVQNAVDHAMMWLLGAAVLLVIGWVLPRFRDPPIPRSSTVETERSARASALARLGFVALAIALILGGVRMIRLQLEPIEWMWARENRYLAANPHDRLTSSEPLPWPLEGEIRAYRRPLVHATADLDTFGPRSILTLDQNGDFVTRYGDSPLVCLDIPDDVDFDRALRTLQAQLGAHEQLILPGAGEDYAPFARFENDETTTCVQLLSRHRPEPSCIEPLE